MAPAYGPAASKVPLPSAGGLTSNVIAFALPHWELDRTAVRVTLGRPLLSIS